MLVPTLMLFVLMFMSLFFSVLISDVYAHVTSTSLSVRSSSSPVLPPIKSMLSANCSLRAFIDLLSMEMDVCLSTAYAQCRPAHCIKW